MGCPGGMPPKISLDDVLTKRLGVLTRRQAFKAGFTEAMIRSRLELGSLAATLRRRLSGLDRATNISPARLGGVLAAGPGAVASHSTAGVLLNILPPNEDPITVSVLTTRNPRRRGGLIVRRRHRIQIHRHSNPRHTTPVQTTLDLVADSREAADVVSTAIRCLDRGRIRPDEIRTALENLPMQPSRALLFEMVSSVESGVRSPLEHRYRRDVEQGHDLPQPTRQSPRRGPSGWFVRDLDYRPWRLDRRTRRPAQPRSN